MTAELRRLAPSCVAISGEVLRAFAPADVRAQLGGGATYRVAGALARAYLELGAERVIFDYLCLRAAHLRYFSEALPEGIELKVFTLWPPLETLLERERARLARVVSDTREGVQRPGVADCYREMASNLPSLGETLDTAELSPALAAGLIHERCSQLAPHL